MSTNRILFIPDPMRLLLIAFIVVTLSGCKKPVEACFEFSISETDFSKIYFNSDCSEGAVAYDWEFGDGATSIAASPSHTYQYVGEFSVTLRITSEKGEMNTVTHWIRIEEHCVECKCYDGEVLLFDDEMCGNYQDTQDWCNSCLSFAGSYDCTCE